MPAVFSLAAWGCSSEGSSSDASVLGDGSTEAGNCACRRTVRPQIPQSDRPSGYTVHVRESFWRPGENTDIYLRYVQPPTPFVLSRRVQESLLPSVLRQSRECVGFLRDRYRFSSGYSPIQITIEAGLPVVNLQGVTFNSAEGLVFDPFQHYSPEGECYDPRVLSQFIRFMFFDSPYPSSGLTFRTSQEYRQFINSPDFVLFEGLAVYLANQLPPFRYPTPVETPVNLREIRQASADFSACMARQRTEVCRQNDPSDCCLSHYRGLRTVLNFERNASPVGLAAELFIHGVTLWILIDGENRLYPGNVHIENGTVDINGGWPYGDVIHPTGVAALAFQTEQNPQGDLAERGVLFLFKSYGVSRRVLKCGESTSRESNHLFLEGGRILTQSGSTREASYESRGGFDVTNTAACFWNHLEQTYGHENFVRLMERLQRADLSPRCRTPVDIIEIFAENLGTHAARIESDMRRFHMNPDIYRRVTMRLVCE